MDNSSKKIVNDNIFILYTKNSEAIFNNSKLIGLSFTVNQIKHKIIDNVYADNNFLIDGSYLMFPWIGRIQSDEFLNKLNKELTFEYPFKDSNNNALHGFLANTSRQLVNKTDNSISFKFEETKFTKLLFDYFPEIIEKYTLSNNKLTLDIEFTNNSENFQYFNYGYHPYFQFDLENISNYKLQSTLIDKKWVLDEKLLVPIIIKKEDEDNYTFKKQDYKFDGVIIDKNQFDNLFEIEKSEKEIFEHGNYLELIKLINEEKKVQIKLATNIREFSREQFILLKYIQIYTPEERNRIAIEPMSGPSNSFNYPDLKYNVKIKPKEKLYSNFEIELKNLI